MIVSIGGIKADGLFISGESFLVTLEVFEGDALTAVVVVSIVGIKTDSLVIGSDSILVAFEVSEGDALLKPFLTGFKRSEQVF